jgi:hypothetical protein
MDVLNALRSVYEALQPLDSVARARVVASLQVLLGEAPEKPNRGGPGPGTGEPLQAVGPEPRPPSLIELMHDKNATTGPQRITLFAYYRDKYQAAPRFARADLEPYFAQAKEKPPANYDRDFVEAVRRGWLHEDSTDSYITSTGIEAVESRFANEGRHGTAKKSTAKKSTAKKSTAKKSTAKKSTAKKSTAKKST